MRSFLLSLPVLALTTLLFTLQTSADSPYRMKTRLDSELHLIVDTLGGALLKRLPNLDKTSSFILSKESVLEEGKIVAEYTAHVVKNETELLLSSKGILNLQLADVSAQKSTVTFEILGNLAAADLLKLLDLSNEALCSLKGEATCELAAVTSPSDLKLAQDEQVRLSAERLKENARQVLKPSAATQPERKTISFGGSAPAAPKANSSIVSDEVAASLTDALDAVNITVIDGKTEIALDMERLKGIDADWEKINPMLPFILSFKSVAFVIEQDRVAYRLVSGFEIPTQVIASYDGYLAEQQNRAEGLKPLSELVTKMGAWAVGRCSNEQYQALCLDKLLNGCTKDISRVGSCLSEAESIQAARESSASGDHLGAAAKGAEIFGKEVLHSVDDGVSGFFNWVIGNDQQSESDEDPNAE